MSCEPLVLAVAAMPSVAPEPVTPPMPFKVRYLQRAQSCCSWCSSCLCSAWPWQGHATFVFIASLSMIDACTDKPKNAATATQPTTCMQHRV
eukprot:349679-Chlamydomonas_euryale.AAC.14